MQKNSVHLQDFPDLSFLDDNEKLVCDMDLVREICSTALSIRDNKNLRVRLPLKSLTIVGLNSLKILDFKEIIADEVNVKELRASEDFADFANLKLQLNFKKIGAKFGTKVKEITAALKEGKWQKISSSEVEIAGEKLTDDEFELKLEIKNRDDFLVAAALPSNDFLVLLDTELSDELINEGIARDIVRVVQQKRKEADLKITDEIFLELACDNPKILQAIEQFQAYIASQVLAKSLQILPSLIGSKHCFKAQIEEGFLEIGFKL
jgi:isoleucyl-tRNA synthetase